MAFYLWQDVREAEFFAMNEMDFNMRERFVYIQNIISLKYYCLLPLLKDNKNNIIFEDLLYYLELNSLNELGINKDNNLIIEATIINMDMINKIKIAKSDKDIIDSSKSIIINYDLSTNSAFISLSKIHCENIWNNLNNHNGNAYLYISINKKNQKKLTKIFQEK